MAYRTLLLVLALVVSSTWGVTCTLAPSGGDFSTLQAAVNGCRAAGDPNVLISIANGTYPCAGLIIPTDVQSITLRGVVGNYSNAKLDGVSWNVDSTFSYPSLTLQWLTVDLGQQNVSLFDPPLKNNNLTIDHVEFRHFLGPYLIEQESCVDNTTFISNSTWFIDGGGIYNNLGTLTLTSSSFSGNAAGNTGGGPIRVLEVTVGAWKSSPRPRVVKKSNER